MTAIWYHHGGMSMSTLIVASACRGMHAALCVGQDNCDHCVVTATQAWVVGLQDYTSEHAQSSDKDNRSRSNGIGNHAGQLVVLGILVWLS